MAGIEVRRNSPPKVACGVATADSSQQDREDLQTRHNAQSAVRGSPAPHPETETPAPSRKLLGQFPEGFSITLVRQFLSYLELLPSC